MGDAANGPFADVPEPSGIWLLAVGLVCFGLFRRTVGAAYQRATSSPATIPTTKGAKALNAMAMLAAAGSGEHGWAETSAAYRATPSRNSLF